MDALFFMVTILLLTSFDNHSLSSFITFEKPRLDSPPQPLRPARAGMADADPGAYETHVADPGDDEVESAVAMERHGARWNALRDDFHFNLRLLNERDAHIDNLEAELGRLREALVLSREVAVSEALAASRARDDRERAADAAHALSLEQARSFVASAKAETADAKAETANAYRLREETVARARGVADAQADRALTAESVATAAGLEAAEALRTRDAADEARRDERARWRDESQTATAKIETAVSRLADAEALVAALGKAHEALEKQAHAQETDFRQRLDRADARERDFKQRLTRADATRRGFETSLATALARLERAERRARDAEAAAAEQADATRMALLRVTSTDASVYTPPVDDLTSDDASSDDTPSALQFEAPPSDDTPSDDTPSASAASEEEETRAPFADPPALSTPDAAAVLASRFNEDGHRLLDCETQSTPPTTAAAVRLPGGDAEAFSQRGSPRSDRSNGSSDAERPLAEVMETLATLSRRMDDQAASAAAALSPAATTAAARAALDCVVAATGDAVETLSTIERKLRSAKAKRTERKTRKCAASAFSFPDVPPSPAPLTEAASFSWGNDNIENTEETSGGDDVLAAAAAIAGRVQETRPHSWRVDDETTKHTTHQHSWQVDDAATRTNCTEPWRLPARARLLEMSKHLQRGGFVVRDDNDVFENADAASAHAPPPKPKMAKKVKNKTKTTHGPPRHVLALSRPKPRIETSPDPAFPPPFRARPVPKSHFNRFRVDAGPFDLSLQPEHVAEVWGDLGSSHFASSTPSPLAHRKLERSDSRNENAFAAFSGDSTDTRLAALRLRREIFTAARQGSGITTSPLEPLESCLYT